MVVMRENIFCVPFCPSSRGNILTSQDSNIEYGGDFPRV